MPDELKCKYDQDGNGLDDEMEREIARCVVPQVRFDQEEPWHRTVSGASQFDVCAITSPIFQNDKDCLTNVPNSTWCCGSSAWWQANAGITVNENNIHEPNSVFTVTRESVDSVAVSYVMLWGYDGGFMLDDDTGCDDRHEGDTQQLVVSARVVASPYGWRVYPTKMSGFLHLGYQTGTATPEGTGDEHLLVTGTHPVTYASAGKHHFYVSPRARDNTYDIDGTWAGIDWAGLCYDSVLEGGVRIMPGFTGSTQLTHVPDHLEMTWSQPDQQWLNLCEQARGNSHVLATGYQPMGMQNLGYNADLTSPHFVGGNSEVSSAIPSQHGATDVDADGRLDGVSGGHPIADTCVGDTNPSPTDPDGDQLAGVCDPEPAFRNQYVAGGSPTYPASTSVTDSYTPWTTSTGQKLSRHGYLDRDGDGSVEGEDMCPNLPDSSRYAAGRLSSRNLLGEQVNFPRSDDPSWSGQTIPTDIWNLGAYYRGNTCDPYPVTSIEWNDAPYGKPPTNTNNNTCKVLAKEVKSSPGTPAIVAKLSVGQSDNQPVLAQDSRTYNLQGYRCLCDTPDCLTNQFHPCYRNNASPAANTVQDGRGWRPVAHDGCAKDSNGFCLATPVSVKPRTETFGEVTSWDWKQEYLASAAKPQGDAHFLPGDCQLNEQNVSTAGDITPGAPTSGTTHVSFYSCGSYALWSRTENGASFTAPPGLGITKAADQPPLKHYVEPENTSLGASLGAVSTLASFRMRSDFSEVASVKEGWQVTITKPGVPCHDFGPVPMKYLSLLWRVDPCGSCPLGLNQIKGIYEVSALVGTRVTDRLFPRETPQQGYASVTLDATAPSWLPTATGVSTPLVAPQGASSDPSLRSRLLFVETGASTSRWALLEATGETTTSRTYKLITQGQLSTPLSASFEMIGDALGETAALVDRSSQRVIAFDPALAAWINGPSILPLRNPPAASLLLVGQRLLVAYPSPMGPDKTEAQLLDIHGSQRLIAQLPVPSREGARWLLASDRSTLLAVGGRDGQSRVHDDVWSVALVDGVSPSVSLLQADSSEASQFSADRTLVVGGPESLSLQGWRATDGEARRLAPFSRDGRGWHALDEVGHTIDTSCASSDAQGGQLCTLSATWSDQVGEYGCTGSPQAGSCQGAAGTTRWTSSLPTGTVAMAPGHLAVWRSTSSQLQYWTAAESAPPTQTSQVTVPSELTEIATQQNDALLVTRTGVRVARPTASGLSVSNATLLCGRPLHATSLGEGLWLVATSLGHAIVSTRDAGAPVLSSAFSLVVNQGQGQAQPMATTTQALSQCQTQDSRLTTAQVDTLRAGTALTAQGLRHAVASWNGSTFLLDLGQPSAPVVSGVTTLRSPASRFRFDARSQRVYAISPQGSTLSPWLLDARSGWQVVGGHAVSSWVQRFDDGPLETRLRSDSGVDIAWVVR